MGFFQILNSEDKSLQKYMKEIMGKVIAGIMKGCKNDEFHVRQFFRRSAFTVKVSTSITRRENWAKNGKLSDSDRLRSWNIENLSLFRSKPFDLKF